MINKRILSSNFKILRPKKKGALSYPIFLFEKVDKINISKIKTVVFSQKRSVLFFVLNNNDFIVVPLSKMALSFFLKKQLTNIVLFNCLYEKVDEEEGLVVTLHYETTI